jgi:hypothetical protein
MGLRFHRAIRLLPGLRLNLGKTGVSVSLGRPGATVNFSRRGTRSTIGLPGTGLSYSTFKPAAKASAAAESPPRPTPDPLPSAAGASIPSAGIGQALGRLAVTFLRLCWSVGVLIVRVLFIVFILALIVAFVGRLWSH